MKTIYFSNLDFVIKLPQQPIIFQTGLIALPRTIAFTFATETATNYSIEVTGSGRNKISPPKYIKYIEKNQARTEYIEIEETSSAGSNIAISLSPVGHTFYLAEIGSSSTGIITKKEKAHGKKVYKVIFQIK
jgi:hypothetical protein